MLLPDREKEELLEKLLDAKGYGSVEELIADCTFVSTVPCICSSCHTIDEQERNVDYSECEKCGEMTMVSALYLAGVV